MDWKSAAAWGGPPEQHQSVFTRALCIGSLELHGVVLLNSTRACIQELCGLEVVQICEHVAAASFYS
eukprot:1139376-Pelagomonas_calceolata.AAC.3